MSAPNEWPLRAEDVETFRSLDEPTRRLVLRLLESPSERDFAELRQHPGGAMVAEWLLVLPAYAKAYDEDDDVS
jgi:hypothetical protein